MKLAIPVDEKDMNSNVCIYFGRTPYFMIYDTESKQAKFLRMKQHLVQEEQE